MSATEVPLNGLGPFELPLCSHLIKVSVGETLAVLHFETLEGQRVDLPIALAALTDVGELALEAVQVAAGPREGSVQ